ncbi:MAG: IS200/IS605 family accessory protein TnpB-related protein [Microcoleaceae cyanobacterium MO_207.B10]|nr:IS200/IS605 family accessory protein TnpB-related protein [Microcoleaceae cyanobacterium MO_207.B10]
MNKAARYSINWCQQNNISTIVVGVNPGIKQNINLGKKNNQKFVQIPHHNFRFKLKAMCDRYGFTYKEQEESYTSKASFLDRDKIPVYNADNPTEYSFSGKRIKRCSAAKGGFPHERLHQDSVVCIKLSKEN